MTASASQRFTILFVVVAAITWMPVTEVLRFEATGPIFDGLLYLGLVAGVFAVARQNRGRAAFAVALALLAAVFRLAAMLTLHKSLAMASNITLALFFAFIAFLVLSSVMRAPRITSDTIFGAMAVYFLVALGFSLVYFAMELASPGSLLEAGKPLVLYDEGLNPIYAPFVYFSFVTIATLGYGDIVPVSSIMRHLAISEAVLGQLYLAVLVARLVGMKITHDIRASENPPG